MYYDQLSLTNSQKHVFTNFVYGNIGSENIRLINRLIELYDAEKSSLSLAEYIHLKTHDEEALMHIKSELFNADEFSKLLCFNQQMADNAIRVRPEGQTNQNPTLKQKVQKFFGHEEHKEGPRRGVSYSCSMPARSYYESEPEPATTNSKLSAMSYSPEMVAVLNNIASDSYEMLPENQEKYPGVSPTSTFRTTYNTAAASYIIDFLSMGRLPNHDLIREEELLNALDYELNQPRKNDMFAVTQELMEKDGEHYLFLGIKGKEALPSRQNVVILLDVSGSMWGNADITQKIITTIVSKLNDGDKLSLVTYSDEDSVVIDSLIVDKKTIMDTLIRYLFSINIAGCTFGSAGINKAYELIEKNKIANGVNRVILITDGDLNFGVTAKGELRDLIKEKKDTGAYLSCIGVGIWNVKDDKLEALAKNGNGNYFSTNRDESLTKFISNRYPSLMYTIATNVKAQVEFNPKYVASYQMIGFNNRQLSHEDFTNDDVIAEPFGSGCHCIALYKLKLTEENSVLNMGLEYQEHILKESDELATLKLRYLPAGQEKVEEMEFPIGMQLNGGKNVERAIRCHDYAQDLTCDRANVEEFLEFIMNN